MKSIKKRKKSGVIIPPLNPFLQVYYSEPLSRLLMDRLKLITFKQIIGIDELPEQAVIRKQYPATHYACAVADLEIEARTNWQECLCLELARSAKADSFGRSEYGNAKVYIILAGKNNRYAVMGTEIWSKEQQ